MESSVPHHESTETASHGGAHAVGATARGKAWVVAAVFALKFLAGVLWCTSYLGAIVASGWSYRFARRVAFRHWWRRSLPATGGAPLAFEDSVRGHPDLARARKWPNWILDETAEEAEVEGGGASRWKALGARTKYLVRGLAANTWTGLQVLSGTALLTAPGLVYMSWSWYSGWDNSFNFGSEQAWVGPSSGFAGIFLFVAAMLYVPMAQARVAVTGRGRAFFDFSKVARVIVDRWFPNLLIGVAYAALAVPVTALSLVLIGTGAAEPPPGEALGQLRLFLFFLTCFTLPAFVALKAWAARVYASGVLRLVGRDVWKTSDLVRYEHSAICHFFPDGVGDAVKPQSSKIAVRRFVSGISALGFGISLVLLVGAWWVFVSQINFSHFFVARPVATWANHALVQVPRTWHVPKHLREAAAAATAPDPPAGAPPGPGGSTR